MEVEKAAKSPKIGTHYSNLNQFYLDCYSIAALRKFPIYRFANAVIQQVRCEALGKASPSDLTPKCSWFIKMNIRGKKSKEGPDIRTGEVTDRCTTHSCTVDDIDLAEEKMLIEVEKYKRLISQVEEVNDEIGEDEIDELDDSDADYDQNQEKQEVERHDMDSEDEEEVEEGNEEERVELTTKKDSSLEFDKLYPKVTNKIVQEDIAKVIRSMNGPFQLPSPNERFPKAASLIIHAIAAVRSQGHQIHRHEVMHEKRLTYLCKNYTLDGARCYYRLVILKDDDGWCVEESEKHNHPAVGAISVAVERSSLHKPSNKRKSIPIVEGDYSPPPLTRRRLEQHTSTHSLSTPSPTLYPGQISKPIQYDNYDRSVSPSNSIDIDKPITLIDLNNFITYLIPNNTYPYAENFWQDGIRSIRSLICLVTMKEKDLTEYMEQSCVSKVKKLIFIKKLKEMQESERV